MANTLTNLIPSVYEALDVVSRELIGFIPAVALSATAERAAVNQTVYSFVAPPVVASDMTPGVTSPDDGDQVFGTTSVTITKSKYASFRWNGEQTRGINNGGPGVASMQVNQIAQAFRTLANLVEVDLGVLAGASGSRAFGAAGTTPFASDLSALAQAKKILDDNGAPLSDRHFIMGTTAGAAMRQLTQLTNVNQAGDTSLLRQGELTTQPIFNFALRESAQIQTPAIGTSSNTGTTNTAGYAVGATAITLAAAGTGTILAGDFVTFTGDTNKYQVAAGGGVASLAAGGVLTLAAPGLQKALATSAITVTVLAQSVRNAFFTRNALVLAARLPALPDGGDVAIDRTTIVDPRSGLAFELAMYPQFRQMRYQIALAWGVAATKTEHAGVILG